MARLSVDIPDELAERAKSAGLNVSALVQPAIVDGLPRRDTDTWLASLPEPRDAVSHQAVLDALLAARDELEGEPEH